MIPFAQNLEMKTEAHTLMTEAMKLAGETWPVFKNEMKWSTEDIHHFFGHQVGREPREALIKALKLPSDKDYSTFHKYGNMGSCSLPITFAEGIENRRPKPKDKIALLGFGSGINCIFAGIEW